MKILVAIDGYTLAIDRRDFGVSFSGYSRPNSTRSDDSLLIDFLVRNAENEAFWQCFRSREIYEHEEDRFWSIYCQELTIDSSWKLPQTSQNWAVWELLDRQMQIHGNSDNEPICLWHPGSYFPLYCIPYQTALTIINIVRDLTNLDTIEGIEILDEAQWLDRFGSNHRPVGEASPAENRPLLIPQILADLEEAASTYLLLFAEQARSYSPQQAAEIRSELMTQMSIANLLDRELSTDILACLDPYPNLQRCAIQAERLWHYLDRTAIMQEKHHLTLDWLFLDPPAPEPKFYQLCLQQLQEAKLPYPHTIPFEANGKHYRLVTGRGYYREIALLTVLEISPPAVFTNVCEPTYLELVAWAAIDSNPPPVEDWELSLDWRNREDELAILGTDPSLPQAEFFLNCLSSHLATLWQNGDRAALSRGLQSLQCHYSHPEIYWLYCRGQMLLSGKLRFNYSEWFDGGFLRLYQAELRAGRG